MEQVNSRQEFTCSMFAFRESIGKFIFSIMALMFPLFSSGQHQYAGKGRFYAGIEMGVGWLALSQNNMPGSFTARYAFGLNGGYRPFRWMQIGLNVNGWLIEPYGYFQEPEKGISISNTYVQMAFFPSREQPFFAQVQGGWSSYINHHPDNYNAHGKGLKAGVGYEFQPGKRLHLPLTLNYASGYFNDVNYPGISVVNQHYEVIEIMIGLMYR